MDIKTLKEQFSHLFEQEIKKKTIMFSGKHVIKDEFDAIATILSFNVLQAFLNNESETMLQQAFKGDKVTGNTNTRLNKGKEIDFTALLNASGLNLNNPSSYANNIKDEADNLTNIKKFAELTKEAIDYLKTIQMTKVLLENKIKINKAFFNIEIKRILGNKIKHIIDQDMQKINLSNLLSHFKKEIINIVKANKTQKNKKNSN